MEQKAWKWDTGDDVLWLDIGEPVRVRIDSESFHDHDPSQRRHENLPNAPPGEDKSKDGGTNTSTFALKVRLKHHRFALTLS